LVLAVDVAHLILAVVIFWVLVVIVQAIHRVVDAAD
jgi:hypothetical protein